MHKKEDDERVAFFFEAKKWEGEPMNKEPEKCDDLKWFPLDDLPQNIIPYIKNAIQHYRKKVNYSEFGWES